MLRVSSLTYPLIFLVSFLAYCLVDFFWPIKPLIADEFSYLLMGDTFLSGRLANPTHSMWEFFETMHVLQVPSYVSKYPPIHGVILAIGELLFAKAIYGVFFCFSLTLVACYWALSTIVRPGVAIAVTVLLAVNPVLLERQVFSFWGSNAALLGSFLAYGALFRKGRYQSVFVVIGVALMLLARPYEGFFASLPPILYLFLRNYKQALVVALCSFGVVATSFATYNFAVTGSPLEFAYAEYHKQYAIAPFLLFGDFQESQEFRHDRIEGRMEVEKGVGAREKR